MRVVPKESEAGISVVEEWRVKRVWMDGMDGMDGKKKNQAAFFCVKRTEQTLSSRTHRSVLLERSIFMTHCTQTFFLFPLPPMKFGSTLFSAMSPLQNLLTCKSSKIGGNMLIKRAQRLLFPHRGHGLLMASTYYLSAYVEASREKRLKVLSSSLPFLLLHL